MSRVYSESDALFFDERVDHTLGNCPLSNAVNEGKKRNEAALDRLDIGIKGLEEAGSLEEALSFDDSQKIRELLMLIAEEENMGDNIQRLKEILTILDEKENYDRY